MPHSTDNGQAYHRPRHDVTVLGVDPGTLVTGYGLITRRGSEIRLVDCGVIRNGVNAAMPARLQNIYGGLQALISKFRPDELAIESAFYGKNAQSALKLGHARGVSILAAVESGIPTAEYSPREVKKAVVGKGTASKEQVQFMVKSLLRLGDRRLLLDASDALAVALCHLHRFISPASKHNNWHAFVAAHPERVVR